MEQLSFPQERFPPRQKSRVERLKAKVEPVLSEVQWLPGLFLKIALSGGEVMFFREVRDQPHGGL